MRLRYKNCTYLPYEWFHFFIMLIQLCNMTNFRTYCVLFFKMISINQIFNSRF